MELEDGFSKETRVSKASSALHQVGLEGFEKSYPHQLSGGMKMRLSLARSLVLRPDYLLMELEDGFSKKERVSRVVRHYNKSV